MQARHSLHQLPDNAHLVLAHQVAHSGIDPQDYLGPHPFENSLALPHPCHWNVKVHVGAAQENRPAAEAALATTG